MKIKDLFNKDADYNPRSATAEDLEQLDQTLREFGDLSGIVVNTRTDTIISGHQRKKVLDPSYAIHKSDHSDSVGTVAIGYVDTPFGRLSYREVDWDEAKEKAANIAANQGAGRWDEAKRKLLLEDLQQKRYDLKLTGMSRDELNKSFEISPERKAALDELGSQGFGMGMGDSVSDATEDALPPQEKDNGLITININLPAELVLWLDREGSAMGFGKQPRSKMATYALKEYRKSVGGDE